MDEHVYGRFMSRYSTSRHPASTAWFKRGDGLAWVLSLPWATFDDLNRATNAEFLDLLAQDLAERFGDRPVLVDGVEIGYQAAWDDDHTLGARLRNGRLIELSGSVLPP